MAEVRTKLLWIHFLHRVDGGQVWYPSLYACTSISSQFVHPLYHLLLPVDPVQMISQNSQPHWLKNVGILEDDAIGSWGRQPEMVS